MGQPEIVENPLSPRLTRLARTLKNCATQVPEEERPDFTAAAERLQALSAVLEDWRVQGQGDTVYWIDATRSRRGRAATETGGGAAWTSARHCVSNCSTRSRP